MDINEDDSLLEGELTGAIIRLFFRVYDRLGYGFLEEVYCRALAIELEQAGIAFVREAPIEVWYNGQRIGLYRADFLVEARVVVEVKASERLAEANRKQLLNCLRCTKLEVGMLLHFGPKARFERMVYANSRKPGIPAA